MTDDNSNSVDIDDVNLDDFEKEFYNTGSKVEENEDEDVQDDVDENEDDSLANENEDDEELEDDEDDDDDDEDIVEAPKAKKRNRAQERIEKLLERERLANDRAHALELRLAALEAGKEKVQKEDAPTIREQLSADAPNPDAKDKDGNALYELGEFDPQFIRDLTKFTIAQETKAAKEAAQREAQEAQVQAAQEVIRDKWIDNLEKAEAEVPEIRENIHNLVDSFATLEPLYGEYLASTIMNMDSGPAVMNYLSQNIGEAQKIVASGPHAATLALGRLEARLSNISTQQEEKRNTKRVSAASEPPERKTRGSGGKFSVNADTDDLDAFEKEFFKRPRF